MPTLPDDIYITTVTTTANLLARTRVINPFNPRLIFNMKSGQFCCYGPLVNELNQFSFY